MIPIRPTDSLEVEINLEVRTVPAYERPMQSTGSSALRTVTIATIYSTCQHEQEAI